MEPFSAAYLFTASTDTVDMLGQLDASVTFTAASTVNEGVVSGSVTATIVR
jgi:hypothetical protein